jgi:hypothetical protein
VASVSGLPLLACREPTQITLEVTTDVPCANVRGTTVTVGTLDSLEGKQTAASVTNRCQTQRIGSLVLVPSGANDDTVALRVVTGVKVRPDECTPESGYKGCVVARRALRFIPHTPLYLPVEMSQSCLDVTCDPSETCFKGQCVPATIADPESCTSGGSCQPSAPNGGPSDAGGDALDAGADSPEDSSVDGATDAAPDADAASCNPPDAGGVCSVFPQCGCASGQTCAFEPPLGATACVATGNAPSWSACGGPGTCQAGAVCELGSPGVDGGVCYPYCLSASDCAGQGVCVPLVVASGGTQVPIPGAFGCSASCDPMKPGGVCGAGLGCHFVTGWGTTSCSAVGNLAAGASCSSGLSCVPGAACALGTCRPYCRVGKADCGGKSCLSFTTKEFFAGVEYGLCQP